jgi:peptidyl-prolyl cis-trans isomerase SurA
MAIAHSSDSRALEGGDLGWRKAGELPSLFAEQVFALEVGQTAAPIRSGSGFHIVQLLEKRGAIAEVVEQTLVRHILVKPSEIRSEANTQTLINRSTIGSSPARISRRLPVSTRRPGQRAGGRRPRLVRTGEIRAGFGDMMKETPTGKRASRSTRSAGTCCR